MSAITQMSVQELCDLLVNLAWDLEAAVNSDKETAKLLARAERVLRQLRALTVQP